MPRLLPNTEEPFPDTASQPLRAPIRPSLSITQLSATEANEGSTPIGESCVLRPKKAGAATVMFCNCCAI